MNEIIWVLLLIDVLSNASHYLHGILCLLVPAVVMSSVTLLICSGDGFIREEVLALLSKTAKISGVSTMVVLVLLTLIPSKQTMQIALGLYATNQAVTYVADTDIAKQALSTLELKLKSIEQDLKKEMEEQDSGK